MRSVGALPGTRLIAASSLWQTRPVGQVAGPFVNAAMLVETALPAKQLMQQLLELEAACGRDRRQGGNRPLDLDLLLYGQRVIDDAGLIVPHPRMSFRRFVLEPAVEIAGSMQHPLLQLSLQQLLSRIRCERNVVAVLLPPEFPAGEIDLRPAGDVFWVVPGSRSELLLALRQHVTANQNWLVVVADRPGRLEALQGAIKLLVTIDGDPPGRLAGIRFRGPQASLRKVSAAGLRQSVLTLIDSLRPGPVPINGGPRLAGLQSLLKKPDIQS
jgi:2-amino-4-hydroxy-6-hydroxymethyldihydropteridine diphosphokinase